MAIELAHVMGEVDEAEEILPPFPCDRSRRLRSINVLPPLLHQRAPPLEQVGASVGRLDLVRHHMRERRFR